MCEDKTMEINYVTIGRKIRTLRINRQMTQEDLAFMLETSPSYVSNIENGKKKPSLKKLGEISDIFGVSINDLLSVSISFEDEFSEMVSLCPPDKRKQLLESLSSIIQLFIIN